MISQTDINTEPFTVPANSRKLPTAEYHCYLLPSSTAIQAVDTASLFLTNANSTVKVSVVKFYYKVSTMMYLPTCEFYTLQIPHLKKFYKKTS